MITPGSFQKVVEVIDVISVKGPSGAADRRETVVATVYADVITTTDDEDVQMNATDIRSLTVTTYNYPKITTSNLLRIEGRKYNVLSTEDKEMIYVEIRAREFGKS